jgi:glutaredoxin
LHNKGLIVAIATVLFIAGITLYSKWEQARQAPPAPSSPVAAAPAGTPLPAVELYTTNWCPACREAVKFLQDKGIPFREFDVEKDAEADARFRAMNPTGSIPLAVIGGEKILGFDPQAYERALGLK